MGKAPAFQIYGLDFDMDTATWENDEIGAYLRLLFYQWFNGGLPNDTYKLSKIVRESEKKFKKKWEIISTKFIQNGNGLLVNKKLEEIRQNQSKYSESRRKNVSVRYKDKATHEPTYVEDMKPVCNLSSSSSSSSINKKKRNILSDDEFLTSLKEKFTWVDFEKEMAKIDAWLLANPGRQKTRRFIVKWISKVEKPMGIISKPIPHKEIDGKPSWIGDAMKDGWKI